jgi:hypothetical protein
MRWKLVTVTALYMVVLGACSGSAATGTTQAAPHPVGSTVTASEAVVNRGTDLPKLRLAHPPVPTWFAGMSRGRVAIFDTKTARLLRYLTPPTVGPVDNDVVATSGSGDGTRVWFVHTSSGSFCGSTSIYSESVLGGSPTLEVRSSPHEVLGKIAVNGKRHVLAYTVGVCHKRSLPGAIVIRARNRATRRLLFPAKFESGDLTLEGGHLSFLGGHANARGKPSVYSVAIDRLVAGNNSMSVATKAPDPGAHCQVGAITAFQGRLLAARTCVTKINGFGPTRLFLLNPTTLVAIQRGPQVAFGLQVDGLDSDAAGHLLVWRDGGGFVGPILTWTSAGRHQISAGHCGTGETFKTKCPSKPMW